MTWLLMMILSAASAGTFFVGNSGGGVSQGDRIVLRDFHEAGVTRPFIGMDRDEALVSRVLDMAPLLDGGERDLLVRKLSDLNRFLPGLGFVVVTTLRAYRIDLVDRELPLVPDRTWNVPEERRVQVATRMGRIEISRPAWNRMDGIGRVGLLIHEGISPLLRTPSGEWSDSEEEMGALLRSIVAGLFRPGFLMDEDLRSQVQRSLAWASVQNCRGRRGSVRISLSDSATRWSEEFWRDEKEKMNAWVGAFCRKAEGTSLTIDVAAFSVDIRLEWRVASGNALQVVATAEPTTPSFRSERDVAGLSCRRAVEQEIASALFRADLESSRLPLDPFCGR